MATPAALNMPPTIIIRNVDAPANPTIRASLDGAADFALSSNTLSGTQALALSGRPDLIVAKAVDKLHLKSPIDRKTLDDMVKAGLERLYSYQHDDGGWGWWPDDSSRVFMTAYVVSGLGQAQGAGYTVDGDRENKARNWLLATLAAHPDMIPDLRAYAVYALATTGTAPKDALEKAWGDRNKLSGEGLALTGLTLDAAGDGRVPGRRFVGVRGLSVTNGSERANGARQSSRAIAHGRSQPAQDGAGKERGQQGCRLVGNWREPVFGKVVLRRRICPHNPRRF